MHTHNEGSTDRAVLGYLLLMAAIFAVFAAVFYSLLRPTIIPNWDSSAKDLRPKPAVSLMMTLADQERMERASLEEAKLANNSEIIAVEVEAEHAKVVTRTEPKRKRTANSGRRPTPEITERPQQIGSAPAGFSFWSFF
jgi:hypothetical protein